MHKAHIALQELQSVAFMLCSLAFQLSGKVVALHLDNSSAQAYLCNQGVTVSLFSRLACCIMNLADKCGITLIPAYIPAHLCVEMTIWHGESWSRVTSSSFAQAASQLWGQLEGDLLTSSCTN